MRIPEPLRNSPLQMYKRKSPYTGLYGSGFANSTDHPGDFKGSYGVHFRSVAGPEPKTYMSDIPKEYTPHPGPMQMPRKDYKPYNSSMVDNIHPSVQPVAPGGFPISELPRSIDAGVSDQDSQLDIDSFEPEIWPLKDHFDLPRDNTEVLRLFQKARAEREESEFDEELRAQTIEIQMAVERMRAEPFINANPESRDVALTTPQDFFEKQEQLFESQFHALETAESGYGDQMEALFDAQEALFDSLQNETASIKQTMPEELVAEVGLGDIESESLEQIVDANEIPDGVSDMLEYDNSLMLPDTLDQEMSEVPEPMEPEEPYPDPSGHYGGMIPQEMYDEQIPGMMDPYMTHEMMDPYMMPGMVDPYMMPGPWGPMPGPGPGGP